MGTPANLSGKVTGFARKRLLWVAAPFVAIAGAIVAVIALVMMVAGMGQGASAQAEMNTVKEASGYGLSSDEILTIRSVSADLNLPWQILVALAVAESGQQPVSQPAGAPTTSTPSGSPDTTSAVSSDASTPTTSSTSGSDSTSSVEDSAAGWGRYAIAPDAGLSKEQAEDLAAASKFIGVLLQASTKGQPGFSGAGSLIDEVRLESDGMHVDTDSDLYKAREKTFVAALVKLPVANNNEPFMTHVYEAAQAWALGQSATCVNTGTLGTISGGGLSTNVPEPMRSEIIRAAQDAGVAPSAVAALYLTEQNGFQFIYSWYDNGKNDSAFQPGPTDPVWHLDRYGTTGEWPAGGTFRGPFQFGPIWESKYQTPQHPDVLKFADAAFGAAHYMADLGAKGDDVESIRKAAQSYNGQKSWDIGGGHIRNPDPAKYKLVQELYADQVAHLAVALSDGTGTGAPSTEASTSSPAEPSTSQTGTAESSTGGSAVTTTVVAAAASGSQCSGIAGGMAGSVTGPGGVTVLVSGTKVTIPNNAEVVPALQGKQIVAPTPEIAKGIAYGISQLGVPYVYGGGGLGSKNAPPNVPAGQAGPDDGCNRASCLPLTGFDCSGLSWTVLDHAGIDISEGTSSAMAAGGTHIPLAQAVAGDLITYGGSATHHVAISLGWIDGQLAILEAPATGLNVRIRFTTSSDINDWASRYWQTGSTS